MILTYLTTVTDQLWYLVIDLHVVYCKVKFSLENAFMKNVSVYPRLYLFTGYSTFLLTNLESYQENATENNLTKFSAF